MSTTPERLAQGQEELRGDYEEIANRISFQGAAAGTALLVPLYLDGRLAYSSGGLVTKGDSGARLVRMQLIFTAAVALNGATYWTVNLNRYNAGVLVGAAGALGTFNTSATAVVARTPIDIGTAALNGTLLSPGDYLELAFAHTSTGALIPPGLAVLEYSRLGV